MSRESHPEPKLAATSVAVAVGIGDDSPQKLTDNNVVLPVARTPKGTVRALGWASASLLTALVFITAALQPFSMPAILTALLLWAVMATTIGYLSRHHHHESFGYANTVTTARAVAATILAGFIPIASQISSTGWLWAITITATVALCLDGVDGYLARKYKSCSAFGARFDMETDAFLALVITLFLWQSEKTGIWVLGMGLMRYVFIGAALWFAALRAELYPSMRRKSVCVIQVGALCLMLCPWLSPFQAASVGLLALACLVYSFAIDVFWLFRTHAAVVAQQQKQPGQARK